MVKTLVLLESGVALHICLGLVRTLDKKDKCLILSEGHSDLDSIRELGVEAHSLDEYIPLGGEQDATLFADACRLVDQWISEGPLSEHSGVLEHDGISLWQTSRLINTSTVYKILKRVEVLRTVLTSAKWDGIYVLVSQQTLWEPLQAVVADLGFDGEVQRVIMESYGRSINLLHRLYRSVARGWGDQVALDIIHAMKSRHPLRLFRSYRKRNSKLYLFLSASYSTYLFTLLPIIERAKAANEVIVLGHGDMAHEAELQKHGIFLSYWSPYVPLSAWPRIVRQSRELRRIWDQLQTSKRFRGQFQHNGMSLWPALQNPLRAIFVSQFPRMILWIEALKNIFESVQPCVVATVPDRKPVARIALALAKQYGVPSLTIQPALYSDHPQYGPLYADKVAVIDEHGREVYAKRGGITPERMVITGSPRWDSTFTSKQTLRTPKGEIRRKLGLHPSEKLVVFATEGVGIPLSNTQRMIQAVLYAMSPHDNTRLVIKLHPTESLEQYNGMFSDLDWTHHQPIIMKDIDLYSLLAVSDLLITGFSNVALEAALLDKPVLTINLTGEPDPLPFVRDGIALGAYSEVEIKQQFDRIICDDTSTREQLQARRHQYMKRNPQLLDGKAVDRIIEMLRQMTRN